MSSVENNASGSRRTCRTSLRATVAIRRSGVLAIMTVLLGSGPLAGAGQRDEDVLQARLDRAAGDALGAEGGEGAVGIDEGVNRLAEQSRFPDAAPAAQPGQQGRAVARRDLQPSRARRRHPREALQLL